MSSFHMSEHALFQLMYYETPPPLPTPGERLRRPRPTCFFRFVNLRRRLTRQDCNTNIWPAFIFCIFWFVLALNITTVWTTTKYLFFFLLSQFWFCVRCCGQCQSWIRVAGVFFPFHDYRHNRNRIPSQHANGCFLGNQLALSLIHI